MSKNWTLAELGQYTTNNKNNIDNSNNDKTSNNSNNM